MANLSPMMEQYMSIKEKYKDCILFFRLGDFYEMFFEDALLVSKELELTLTGKNCGLEERAPMCGVPYHSASQYIQKLIDNGYKVAICEQLTDPSESKGLVERDVIRVITKGTVVDQSMLDEDSNSYIASIFIRNYIAGIAYADISTGEFFAYEIKQYNQYLKDEISKINPNEIIYNNDLVLEYTDRTISATKLNSAHFNYSNAKITLKNHFNINNISDSHIESQAAIIASGALLSYLNDTQKIDLSHIKSIKRYIRSNSLYMDDDTRYNLELTKSLKYSTKKGSLLWVLDKTQTAMGSRQLRSWVEQPLAVKEMIEERLDIVSCLKNNFILCDSLRQELKNIYDLERIISKIVYKTINPKDCLAISRSLRSIPEIINLIKSENNTAFFDLIANLDPMEKLADYIDMAIDEDCSSVLLDGGYIKSGFNKELDELRNATQNGKEWLLELENKEKELTGIKNLKISYNRVFGYYIEVSKSNIPLVPLRYTRKQTLTNSERYITKELHEIENKIINASQNAIKLEAILFENLRLYLESLIYRMQVSSSILKKIDAYCSLASVAIDNDYIRPEINNDGIIDIKDGRHPIIEYTCKENEFIPNDILLDTNNNRMLIITGPNMSGKSTYMRQAAIISIMAHIGSFVPASFANISILDSVFTRIGAYDSLAEGQSTFMVEMSQTAKIIKQATNKSLIILDEIGRGTSTFDGLSIAWAVVEYITKKIGAKTLFATHYHELATLEDNFDGVKNYCVDVKEHGNDVIFLHKIRRGGADKSYGIHVAKLAGIPFDIIKRAQSILYKIDASDINKDIIAKNIIGKSNQAPLQIDMFHTKHNDLIDYITSIDVLALTPMQAMEELFKITERAKKI